MAETVKTQDELLAQFPDNNLNEISAQDLRDFVVSVGVYGELKRMATGAQTIGIVSEVLNFDVDGLFENTTPDFNTDDVEIETDGVYDVRFEGSVEMQTGRTFELAIGIDGVAGMVIATLEGKGDIVSVVGACLIELTAGQKVSIMAVASLAASNFFMQVGTRCKVDRKL